MKKGKLSNLELSCLRGMIEDEADIKEIEVLLLHLKLEQRDFQTFKTQWLQQWGQYLESDSND